MIKVSQSCLGEEELEAVREAFAYGYFGLTSKVSEFENMVSTYLGTPRVVATNTGTSALHLALDAVGIRAQDEVIVPSLTFVASFQAITAVGATPVACDVNPDTLLMDVKDVRRRLTPRTKAIMPVHYCGNPCDMDELLRLKSETGVRIIEDAAHAFGSSYEGRLIGSFGDVTCFSFDSIKNITCGEGGVVIAPDAELETLIRQKLLLGMNRGAVKSGTPPNRSGMFEVATQGYRYHMSSINAAIGTVQMRKLDAFIQRRREICQRYDAAFDGIAGLRTLKVDYSQTAPHIYVLRVRDGRRDSLLKFLKQRDIECGINYIPNHLHPFFKQDASGLQESEAAYREILTIPLHCRLTDSDVETIISSILELCKTSFF